MSGEHPRGEATHERDVPVAVPPAPARGIHSSGEAAPYVLTTAPEDYETPLAVGVRRLYTKLRPRLWRGKVGVLMLTSGSVRGEGRSTIASNLAITVARHKRTPTLLLDGDLSHAAQHRVMQLARGKGFSDLLSGGATLDEVLRETPYENLRLMTAGTPVERYQALFDGQALGRVIAQLAARFDLVILDAPPALPAAEAIVMGAAVDGVLLVVTEGFAPRGAVVRACQALAAGGARLLGAVVNLSPLPPPRFREAELPD